MQQQISKITKLQFEQKILLQQENLCDVELFDGFVEYAMKNLTDVGLNYYFVQKIVSLNVNRYAKKLRMNDKRTLRKIGMLIYRFKFNIEDEK